MSQPWSITEVVRRLTSPAGLADPYAVYREIRAAADAGESTGRFLFRYEDVREAVYDRELSSNRVSALLRPLPDEARRGAGLLERTMRDIIVFTDQPDHRRLRRLLTKAFTPRMVEQARPMIARAADRLLDALTGDVVDIHSGLTHPLPAVVVGELLGIPDADRAAFQSWALDLVFVVGSGRLTPDLAERAGRGMAAMRALMARLVDERRRDPVPTCSAR